MTITLKSSSDNLGRLDTVLDEGNEIADYEFNVDGTIRSLAYNNGININYGYDLDKNITSLINSNAQGGTLNSFEYTYDNNGNQLTKLENSQTTTYTYDELNRLKTALYPELGLETYTYDNAGNRKSKVLGSKTTTYNYDDNNRLIQSAENGIITTYSYDNNGNLLEEAVNGAKTLYTYDGFNKLAETVKPDGKWLHNEYSAEGFRIATEENGFRYDFVFDRGNIITEVNANTQQVTRSIRGIGLVGQEDSKGNLNYYLNNAHGDVVSLVDAGGQILNSYQYDAFGNTTNYAEKVANRFMYAGEQFDKITGQYYLRARYYNPAVGRFTQEDTYRGDGLNLYAYVANNPLKYVDPSGYCKDGSGYDNTYIEELRLINELSGSAKTAAQRAKVAFDRWYDSVRGTDEDRSGVIQFQNDLLRLSNQGINVSRMSTSDLKKLYAASLRWSGEYWTGITTLAMSLLGQAGNVADDVAVGAGKLLTPSQAANKIVNAERVGSGLKNDIYHRAASYLSESQLSKGTVYDLGNNNILLQVKGGLNGKTGIFEYILNRTGQVTHQLFKEGGVINGIPN